MQGPIREELKNAKEQTKLFGRIMSRRTQLLADLQGFETKVKEEKDKLEEVHNSSYEMMRLLIEVREFKLRNITY